MSRKNGFPARFPRAAGGIRLQESRGGAARAWWARRWTEALERISRLVRFGRGRVYARSGQVVELAVAGSVVTAKVVGARPGAYRVKVVFRRPDAKARRQILARLRAEPMLVARLVAGDLPTEVETIFREAGCELFPGAKLGPGLYDMTTTCSCPDYANPCKHAFAVLLLLGEEIAANPMRLLNLRGISEDDLVEA